MGKDVYVHVFLKDVGTTTTKPRTCIGAEHAVVSYGRYRHLGANGWYTILPFLFVTLFFPSMYDSLLPLRLTDVLGNLQGLGKILTMIFRVGGKERLRAGRGQR